MKVLRQSLLRKYKQAVTVVELLIACSVLCVVVWSSRYIYIAYRALVFSTVVDQVTAVCHGLTHHARLFDCGASLRVIPPSSYSINNGPVIRLPYGIVWGVRDAEVYGPPSNPTQKLVTPVVGGEYDNGAYVFDWYQSGARTSGTLYFSSADGACAAITLSRASCGVVTPWRLKQGRWIKHEHR
jgi:hypothetical protein